MQTCTSLPISTGIIKKLLLCVYLFSGNNFTFFAQNIDKNHVDGSLYFKIKKETPFRIASGPGGQINLDDVLFLNEIRKHFKIKKLTKSFFTAQSDELQRTFRLEFTDVENADKLIEALYKTGIIEQVNKVPLFRTTYIPNDVSFPGNQWYLTKIKAERAWDYSKGNPDVVVAIIDNGVDIQHPDLKDNIWINKKEIAGNGIDDDGNGYKDDVNGWDMADNDNNPSPPSASYFHGTHCAGDAAAVADNSIGIASIGFNVSIMAIKAASSSGNPDLITMGLEGIVYAADAGASVISNSWGLFTSDTGDLKQIDEAVAYAYSKGCIILAAAGNNNTSSRFYPAASNHVISVAATNQDDTKRSSSNYGTWIDISAPGDLYSTMPNASYKALQGTSMACPLTAGLCALMLSLNATLTPAQVESCLKSSADNINGVNPNYTGKLGSGRINAEAAMKCVASTLTSSASQDLTGNQVLLYPNPGNSDINLSLLLNKKNDYQVIIRNMLGEAVFSERLMNFNGEYTHVIPLIVFGKGVYIFTLQSNEEQINRKVIIE